MRSRRREGAAAAGASLMGIGEQPRNPLHGVTLERMLHELVEHYGWEAMGERIRIRSFTSDPSVASSLKFLRKTPWAREKVESLYLSMLREKGRARRRG
jgi:uncharacterized protein (DUF2132 family)